MPLLLLSMRGLPQYIHLLEHLRNLRSSIDFYGFTDIQTVLFKEFFFIHQIHVRNSKVKK